MSLKPLQKPFAANFFFCDLHPRVEDVKREVLAGLGAAPKRLPPKLFYDPRGSDLFNMITAAPEYYLTRTETGILRGSMDEIRRLLGKDCTLIEFGCGSSEKIDILLEGLDEVRAYVAIDLSRQHLLNLSERVALKFSALEVLAVCADYSRHLDLPVEGGNRVIFFPGSSIGNFEPEEAVRFLENMAKTLGGRGGLLIGVDLKKDSAMLDAAYNDGQGLTAAFNRNLLIRINRECGADFIPEQFQHSAFYNPAAGRVEMHLVSRVEQTVHCNGAAFRFAAGEGIHTENSYKYSVEDFQRLARDSGWKPRRVFTDARQLFSLHYLSTGS